MPALPQALIWCKQKHVHINAQPHPVGTITDFKILTVKEGHYTQNLTIAIMNIVQLKYDESNVIKDKIQIMH